MEIIVVCLSNLLCFIVGAKVGQKIVRQEKIELNPVKVVKNTITEHKVQKEKEAEDEYIKAILHNIDVYDGTSVGQVKVPKRK
jgi:hypothetical protein